jgi:two-component system sensor histidine kinase PilS (NtrC family)
MASISGSIEMLKEGLETSDVNSRLISIISREVDRLNNLVKDFQTFARPKKPVTDIFELNQLILDSLELIKRNQFWHEKIKVRSDFQQEINLESDSQQIKQILWNLFLNACEAMPGGGILYVKTSLLRNAATPHAEIVIRDTGTGFQGTSPKKAFEPFFTTKEEGSGLGLAIVKSIVESLHGEIDAGNDSEGGGARIFLRLPLTQPSRNSAPTPSAPRNT